MSGPLAALAPALLAAIVAQGPKTPTPPCLPPEAHLDDFETGWFCGQLAAAGKGRLDGPKAFRLLYLPSFRPATIVEVRQERNGWMIQTTILSGAGGGPPGDIRERRQRWLTDDDVLDLEAAVNRSGVWRPTHACTPTFWMIRHWCWRPSSQERTAFTRSRPARRMACH
jgi:hypothetical protein